MAADDRAGANGAGDAPAAATVRRDRMPAVINRPAAPNTARNPAETASPTARARATLPCASSSSSSSSSPMKYDR